MFHSKAQTGRFPGRTNFVDVVGEWWGEESKVVVTGVVSSLERCSLKNGSDQLLCGSVLIGWLLWVVLRWLGRKNFGGDSEWLGGRERLGFDGYGGLRLPGRR